ncbi:uncharacterized protein LOC129722342 [Wyeomyia smithii]|uniref:uncharacterized protein LOC129722342 n=1 Tax=Wyeomyia smithii TaxID=174621 RepID=UPI002467E50F|nr:uncharacterized protein LOC129722342 [Wyeomyia smithii]
MITHWSFLLGLGLLVMTPALARPDPYQSELNPKADIPSEILYNDLVDEMQKLHNKEDNYLQYLAAKAIRQQREEDLLQQKQQELQQQLMLQQSPAAVAAVEEAESSNLDEVPAESPIKTLNRLHTTPKLLSYPKARDEKKSNIHYMSLCHFKLCNMGRKRNTRFLHFWK